MKLKKSLAFVLILAMMVPFLASCKTEVKTDPVDIWNEAAGIVSDANTLSYTAKVIIGNNKASFEFAEDKIAGASSYNITINETNLPIYKNKDNTYYSFSEFNFFVKNSENHAMLEKLMSFSITNQGKLSLNAEDPVNLVFNQDETSTTFTFNLTGEKFKSLLGINDNVTFSACTVNARLNNENKFTFIDFTTKIKGSELFGIPLLGDTSDFREVAITIENIDFTENNKANPPENASQYTYMPLMAQVLPTAIIASQKDSSSTSYMIDVNAEISGTVLSLHTTSKTITQVIDGATASRTESTNIRNIFGIESNTVEDAYKNGKDGYTYYTDPNGESYKIMEEAQEDDPIQDSISDLTKLYEILQKATITPNTITVKLSKEDVIKLMDALEKEDVTTPDGATPGVELDEYDFEETEMIIRLENGFVRSFETEIAFTSKSDLMGTGQAQTISISLKIMLTIDSPLQDYVVVAPEGYENYPDWS